MKVAWNGKRFTLGGLEKQNSRIMRIVLIGAGNLATQLAPALADKGHTFVQVYSRTEASASALASVLRCEAVTVPELILPEAAVYLCALKDNVLSSVLDRVCIKKGLLVHTAGSLPMNVLAGYAPEYGVLYPLQTFSKSRSVDFLQVPFFLEASSDEAYGALRALASDLSNKVVTATSEQRLRLHLSAVFACNFVNYLYTVADDLLREKGLDFECLLPLIDETARKVHELSPVAAQTGPAVRCDCSVMDKHLAELVPHGCVRAVYELLSKNIFERVGIKR